MARKAARICVCLVAAAQTDKDDECVSSACPLTFLRQRCSLIGVTDHMWVLLVSHSRIPSHLELHNHYMILQAGDLSKEALGYFSQCSFYFFLVQGASCR